MSPETVDAIMSTLRRTKSATQGVSTMLVAALDPKLQGILPRNTLLFDYI
jgi:hypothetical protein